MKKLYLAILAFAVLATGCEDIFFEEEPENTAIGNFESLWQTFDERYAVFEQRNVDWNAQYELHRPSISDASTDSELYTVLTEMLSVLDDGHVSLMAPGRDFWNAKELFRTQEGFELLDVGMLVNSYLNGNARQIGNQVIYGVFENEIGYIFINHFTDPIDIDGILADLGNIRGLVLDLRHNAGGDFTNAEVVASRFGDERRLAFSGQPKDGKGPNDFGKVTEYYLEPAANAFNNPIAVLTSPYTISAGENMVMYMNILPHVTVIGEATAGAMGERIEKEMPNGWIYSITGQIMRAADGISYEGPGLPPDLEFRNNLEDVESGIDSLFVTAVEHLRSQF